MSAENSCLPPVVPVGQEELTDVEKCKVWELYIRFVNDIGARGTNDPNLRRHALIRLMFYWKNCTIYSTIVKEDDSNFNRIMILRTDNKNDKRTNFYDLFDYEDGDRLFKHLSSGKMF